MLAIMPRPIGKGHNALMAIVRLSVGPVPHPKSRKEDYARWKFAEWKPMTLVTVTPFRARKLRSRSSGRVGSDDWGTSDLDFEVVTFFEVGRWSTTTCIIRMYGKRKFKGQVTMPLKGIGTPVEKNIQSVDLFFPVRLIVSLIVY